MTSSRRVADSAIDGHVYKLFPNDLNANHTVFGGVIMATCDRLALVVAERHSGRVCVTASADQFNFLAPAKDGDTLVFRAEINRAWTTSMEIGVKVMAENSYTGEAKHIVSAYLTFVALDDANQPVAVPAVQTETADQQRRFAEAEIRRQARLTARAHLKAYRESLK
ncbi:MAG: acyl-CoA thioesterase [Pseudomonadota bacterium]